MKPQLESTLRSDLALHARRRQEQLIHGAREVCSQGFRRIKPSQMAAVGELIRRAASYQQARDELDRWMTNTLAKLEARRQRTGKVESWLREPAAGSDKSLGRLLVAWIVEQRYLEAEPPPELDRLAALRQVWDRFHGLYRYRVEMGYDMALTCPSEEQS